MRASSRSQIAAAFAIATLGFILSMTSTGLVEWRVWGMNSTSPFGQRRLFVGLWKVCTYQHATYFKKHTECQKYNRDAEIPVAMHMAQKLMLAAFFLGLMGRRLIIYAWRNTNLDDRQEKDTWKLLITSGIMNITAGLCIFIAVIWNQCSVMQEEGIKFPASFQLPFKPDEQRVGNATRVALLASWMMVLSGLLLLSCKPSADSHVHPEVAQG